jgi:hypothetical protein
MTAAEILRALSSAAAAATPLLPVPGPLVCGFVAAALALAADLADAGGSPDTITRIRRTHPLLAEVDEAWAAKVRERFAPKADALDDIYEGDVPPEEPTK